MLNFIKPHRNESVNEKSVAYDDGTFSNMDKDVEAEHLFINKNEIDHA